MNDPYDRVPPPKNIREVPQYLGKLISGFFSRLAYTVRMVWETGHWILVSMVIIAVLTGIMPMIGSLISKEILNELQNVISGRVVADAQGVSFAAVFWG